MIHSILLLARERPDTFLYVAAVLIAIAVIVVRSFESRVRWRRDANLPDDAARCGRCGYAIRAGSSVICPECGIDARTSGLVARGTPRPMSGGGPWYALVVLLALPVAIVLGFEAAQNQPLFGARFSASAFVYFHPPGSASPSAAPRVCVQTQGRGRYFGRELEYLWAYLMNSDYSHMLGVQPVTLDAHLTDGKTVLGDPAPLSREHVMRLVEAARAPLSPEETARVVDEVNVRLRQFAELDIPRTQRYELVPGTEWEKFRVDYTVADHVEVTFVAVACAICAAVGIIVIWRVRRSWRTRLQGRWSDEAERMGLSAS